MKPLAGDASPRRYFRATEPAAIVMDAPPALGVGPGPFVALTHWLRERGYSAPEIFASDISGGFLVLEDLGDQLFARVCADDPTCEEAVYAAAVDLLVELRSFAPPDPIETPAGFHVVPPCDTALLTREAMLLTEWYLPAALDGATLSSPDWPAQIADLIAPVANDRRTLVLRDFHAENLIWLPERVGRARIGLLDYQDALIGHPAYDVVSLLDDARRDVGEGLRDRLMRRYLDLSGETAETFMQHAARLTAQRNIKILGLFARLAIRDGRPAYLSHLPRVWRYLMASLSHPALTSQKRWIDTHIPPPDAATRRALARAAV